MRFLFVLCILVTMFGFIGCSSQPETPEQLAAKTTAFQLYKSMESKDIFQSSTHENWVVLNNLPEEGYVIAKRSMTMMEPVDRLSYEQLFSFDIKILKSGSPEWIEVVKRDFL